jgi:serine/threonine protein kinase
MPFIEGESIGPYTLLEQLGQGGMATVYKAYHTTLDRYVAIKVLHLAFLEDDNFLARFQREAKAVARLDHPNIIPVYDFAEHEGRPFLVMKYVEGETLKARLHRKKLDQAKTMRIVKSIGSALDYGHRLGVLHRDVKPSNVLLANDGNIYLADYGLARIAQSVDVSLTTDQVIGTPQYMSPEQALGSEGLDGRTDIYSFGVMLYEMVTGRVPFNADTPFAIIHDHIYTPLPLPRQINPEVSEAVERVLLKALAKNKDDRFQTMAEMVNAFELAAQGIVDPRLVTRKIIPPPVSPPAVTQTVAAQPVVGKKPKRKRWFVIVLILLIGAICMVAYGIIYRWTEKKTSDGVDSYLSGLMDSTPEPASTVQPFEQTITVYQQIQPDADLADELLDQSIAAWRRADMNAAREATLKMFFASRGDKGYFLRAFKTMQDEGAWVLIAQVLFVRDRANLLEMTEATTLYAHEVLYRAAEDPLAVELFTANAKQPIFQVARLRQKMVKGTAEDIKAELGKILNKPEVLKEFPEARLLEAEMFLKMGDRERAVNLLNAIMEDEAIPEWIWDLAYDLKDQQSN